MKRETGISRLFRKLLSNLPYKLWVDEVGTFVARLPLVVAGFGTPLQNDALMLKQNTALPAATVTQVTMGSITPTFSKGYIRVKVYGGAVANAIITQITAIVTDGSTFVTVGALSPVVTTGVTLNIVAATGSPYTNGGTLGTNVGGIDLLFPFEVDINCTQVTVLVQTTVATATAVADVEVSATS